MEILESTKLDYVSSHLWHEFLEKISNNEIDFEFLELLKKRLVSDQLDQPRLAKRLKIKPNFFCPMKQTSFSTFKFVFWRRK
jgi:hypothetical protein